MSSKSNSAIIPDLNDCNKVLKKVRAEKSEVFYGKVGDKEDLQIVGIGDASYKMDEKSTGGVILLLVSKDFKKASPIH